MYMRGVVCGVLLLAWLAPAAAGGPDSPPQVPDTLQQRMAACTACHGRHGQGGGDGFNPRLAGKPAGYLFNQLLDFRQGRRGYPMMQHMVSGLSDAYLREFAEYFSQLDTPWPAPPAADVPATLLAIGRRLAEHGDPAHQVPACQACHGQRLTGVQPAIPGLIGLPKDYISNQLGAWRNGSRKAGAPDCMAKVAKRLDGQQIVALAAWLAAQPVPEDPRPLPAGSAGTLPLACGSVSP